MSTVTETPSKVSTAPLATRDDALTFMAKGRTSKGLLEDATRPATVALAAYQTGTTRQYIRGMLLALSVAVGELEAEGVTPPDCWRILDWSLDFVAELLGVPADGAR